ncbi:hypothetical protein AB6A40_000752 [Gnathostoma spinigerum]|uniref:Transthyretin-like family protein n=1 Tax=Gnathostoma spinigerum TaxID=75299 RepID=A0ABD6E2T1_9BILA
MGRLMCGEEPSRHTLVRLIDDDGVGGPNSDDLLDVGFTDSDGAFSLNGSSFEFTNIDPELHIYHDCNNLGKRCLREWVIRIPDNYLYDGIHPRRPMKLGTLNLELELENEERECPKLE